jgi:hypothetical protein
MEDFRYLKQLLDYRPIGRKLAGHFKKPLEGDNYETETGDLLA